MSPTYEAIFSDGTRGHVETEGNAKLGWRAAYGIVGGWIRLVDGITIRNESFKTEGEIKDHLREQDGIRISRRISDFPNVYTNRPFGTFVP